MSVWLCTCLRVFRERVIECVSVCERKRERDRVCVCVRVRPGGICMFVWEML